jgi:hypothetical protein
MSCTAPPGIGKYVVVLVRRSNNDGLISDYTPADGSLGILYDPPIARLGQF